MDTHLLCTNILLDTVYTNVYGTNEIQDKKPIELCYDASKLFDMHDFTMILYDLKVLYQLKNNTKVSFNELATSILGEEEIKEYLKCSNKIKAILNSCKNSKLNIKRFNNEQLFSKELLEKYLHERSEVYIKLFKYLDEGTLNFYEEHFYSFLYPIYSVRENNIKIDVDEYYYKLGKESGCNYLQSIQNKIKPTINIEINPIGAKTGRFSFKKDSLNLYTLPKEHRNIIIANDEYNLLQIDYRAFQPRLAIMSTWDSYFKKKFDVEDIYSVFGGDRETNKLEFIKWMYSNSFHPIFDNEAEPLIKLREEVCRCVKENKYLFNKFGRQLFFTKEEENVIFQNYVTSLEVDAIIPIYTFIFNWLKKKEYKTRILFPYHDSIVFEIHEKELDIIKKLVYIMEWYYKEKIFDCRFPVKVKMGKNFGEMKEV